MRISVGRRGLLLVVSLVLAAVVAGASEAVPPKHVVKLSITLTASAVDPTTGQYTLTVTGNEGYGGVWPSGHLHFTCSNQPAGALCNSDLSWRSTGSVQDPPIYAATVTCRAGDSAIQAFDDDNAVKSNKIKAPAC